MLSPGRTTYPRCRGQGECAVHLRAVRFGAASAHGRANMARFNYFAERGAFTRDPESGTYTVDVERARNVMDLANQAIRNTMALTATRRHGLFAALIRVAPGEVLCVRADLLEVTCPKI